MTDSLKRTASRPWFAPLCLVVLVSLFFIEFLFRDEVLVPYQPYSEVLMLWRPFISFMAAAARSGHAGLWSHNLMAGFPFAAFPHAAAYYPGYLLFLLADFGHGFTLLVMVQMMARGLFVYGLLREWPCSRTASWLVAAAYVLSGPSMHSSGYLTLHDAMTWTPGIYWLALRLARRGKALDFAGLAAVSAIGYLSGELEIMLYTWAIILLFLAVVERPRPSRLLLVGAGLSTGVLCCAAPFLLTLNYLHNSFRGGVEINPHITRWGTIIKLMGALLPALPNRIASFTYIGFLVPFGIVAAFGDKRNRRLLTVLAAGFFLSVIYVINLWPLSYLFSAMPVLKYASFDMRLRIYNPALVLLLVPAALGIERVMTGMDVKYLKRLIGFTALFMISQALWTGFDLRSPHSPSLLAIWRVIFLIGLGGLGWLMMRSCRRQGQLLLGPLALAAIAALDVGAVSLIGMPRTDPGLFSPPVSLPALNAPPVPTRMQMLSPFVDDPVTWRMYRLETGPGFISSFIRNGLDRQLRVLKRIQPVEIRDFEYQAVRSETRPLLDFLAVKYALAHLAPVLLADEIPLDLPVFKSKYEVRGKYEGARPEMPEKDYELAPGSRWTVAMELVPGDELEMRAGPIEAWSDLTVASGGVETAWDQARASPSLALRLNVPRAGEQGISISVSPASGSSVKIRGPKIRNPERPFHETWRGQSVVFYENRESLDLYGLYTAAMPASDDQALDILFDPARFEPNNYLLLDPRRMDPRIGGQAPRPREPGDVRAVEYTDELVVLETTAPSPCYLSIAEAYFPGWRAWVDGGEERIIRADYAYQALALATAGPHRITLRFEPAEFRVGLWASLVSLSCLVLAAVRLTGSRLKSLLQ